MKPMKKDETRTEERVEELEADLSSVKRELAELKDLVTDTTERLHRYQPRHHPPSRRQHEHNQRRALGEVHARGRPRGPTIVVPALPTCSSESVWLHQQRPGGCQNCKSEVGEIQGWERSFRRSNATLMRDRPEVAAEIEARIAGYQKAGTIP